ncbi:MAG: hypothetical protein J1F33_06985 [Clostridiales bacterium]|nr:hypothetical protein [Clostridiales bacterium]
MTKIKERLKNIGFWISLVSSVMLILGAFGVEIGDETVSSVINGVASFLVVCGIVSDPTSGKGYLDALNNVLDAAENADISVATAIKSALGEMQSKQEQDSDNPDTPEGEEKSDGKNDESKIE